MKKSFLKAAGIGAVLLAASNTADAAGGYIDNVEYKDGKSRVTQRYVDCDEAFFVFKNDPKKELWMTCDGYEAADIPIGPNKSDPKRRDNICNFTDHIDTAKPISINDPKASSYAKAFQKAELQAYVHASTQHGNSIAQAIMMRAQNGVDVFRVYDFAIRAPRNGEKPMGAIPTVNGSRAFVLQPGWTKQMLIESSYERAVKMCSAKMGLN